MSALAATYQALSLLPAIAWALLLACFCASVLWAWSLGDSHGWRRRDEAYREAKAFRQALLSEGIETTLIRNRDGSQVARMTSTVAGKRRRR